MKISVDGGGLGAKRGERFGNYVFSENLIKALSLYDKKNHYEVYTFDRLKPRLAWSKVRLSIEEFRTKKDVFLALNQAIPLFVSGKVISFCHGLSYYFYPQYYSKKDNIRLRKQLEDIIKRSDIIVVSSNKVKKELESITVKYLTEKKIVVIPFGIPFDILDKRLLRSVRNDVKPYFLFVGMEHPIKNIEFIRKAFEKFKGLKGLNDYKLLLVTKNISRLKLKQLYQNATALLIGSYYESFNLPVLEALSQSCPVIGLKSAIIPELVSYVNIAENEKRFIELMKTIPKKLTLQLFNQLKQEFSWDKYVKKLVKLY